MFKVALFLLVFTTSSSAFASCLEEVKEFAKDICGQIQTSGSRELITANGKLKAEVSGIVRRVIGNAGGDIDGAKLSDTYENVLREDLSKELFNVRDCRMKMVEVGRSEACSSHAAKKELTPECESIKQRLRVFNSGSVSSGCENGRFGGTDEQNRRCQENMIARSHVSEGLMQEARNLSCDISQQSVQD